MSEAVSVLNGKHSSGFVRVEDAGLQGMITLRGDLGASGIAKLAKALGAPKMPGQRRIEWAMGYGAAWMSPDELLIFCPYDEVTERLAQAKTTQHALMVNVSDARALFRLEGAGVREVIAKLSPVDMAPDAFGPGDFRRTRVAQVPGAFWMPNEGAISLICFRSVAGYMFDLLSSAAAEGSEVGMWG